MKERPFLCEKADSSCSCRVRLADCRCKCCQAWRTRLHQYFADKDSSYFPIPCCLLRFRADVFQNEHQAHQEDQGICGRIPPGLALLRFEGICHNGRNDGRRHLAPLIRTRARGVHRSVLYRARLRTCPCRDTVLD